MAQPPNPNPPRKPAAPQPPPKKPAGDVEAYDLVEESPQPETKPRLNPTYFLGDEPETKPGAKKPAAKPDEQVQLHPKAMDPYVMSKKRAEGRQKMAEEQAILDAKAAFRKKIIYGVIVVVLVIILIWRQMP